MHPRVVIVGTVPYNNQSPSRAFNSYFNGWEPEALAQVFSNTQNPTKGHCGTLYQITDQRMLQCFLGKRIDTGIIYDRSELSSEDGIMSSGISDSFTEALYDIGSHKNSMVYLARKVIWRKKNWCTIRFNRWLDEFRPECVFLSFSDDFFIPEIALYIAEKYNIPIVSSIGDDYYFNYKFSISPLYHLYKLKYRKLIRRVFHHKGSAIYIGDKIRDKYNHEFGLNGKTVFLTSTIQRRSFNEISKDFPVISYFGNIRLGRNESLNDIGFALGEMNKSYILDVYSNEHEKQYINLFRSNPNVLFHGKISYDEVQKRTIESDIVIIPEGFKKKDVDITMYSLSTKVADSLASGVAVFAYGSPECGAIGYAQDTGCITVCTERSELKRNLEELINNTERQRINYEIAIKTTEKNHRLDTSTEVFASVINSVVEGENN